jgi:hypothetical protein
LSTFFQAKRTPMILARWSVIAQFKQLFSSFISPALFRQVSQRVQKAGICVGMAGSAHSLADAGSGSNRRDRIPAEARETKVLPMETESLAISLRKC